MFSQANLTNEQLQSNEDIAYNRYQSGEKPTFSTGICECTTAGYGEIDSMGYWEFPLIVDQQDYSIVE